MNLTKADYEKFTNGLVTRSVHFAPLFDALSDEFNVRGKWTPE